MITLIGTPPNIIVAEFRNDELGQPFAMFDFAPVGLTCAVVGVLFIATIGWRLIPRERSLPGARKALPEPGEYLAELKVPVGASIIGKAVSELDLMAEENDATIVGLIRRGQTPARRGQARGGQRRGYPGDRSEPGHHRSNGWVSSASSMFGGPIETMRLPTRISP